MSKMVVFTSDQESSRGEKFAVRLDLISKVSSDENGKSVYLIYCLGDGRTVQHWIQESFEDALRRIGG